MPPDQKPRLTFNATDKGLAQPGQSLLGSLLAVTIAAVLVVLGFMFSLLILAVIAVLGLSAYGYLWWKTRALRKQMREQMNQYRQEQDSAFEPVPRGADNAGTIIEGEVIREEPHSPA